MSDDLQLYFAITVNQEEVVTGMHTCSNPIEQGFFAGSEEFSGDTVIPVDEMKTGILGLPLAALNEDYTPKSLVWQIENGYAECPPGYELVDGELIEVTTPVEDQPPGHELIDGELIRQDAPAKELPPGIKKRLEMVDARIAALEAEIEKIVPVMTGLGQGVLDFNRIEKPKTSKTTKEGAG